MAREALEGLGRQALHAAELGFEHPATGEPMHFKSELPADMLRLLQSFATTVPARPRRRGERGLERCCSCSLAVAAHKSCQRSLTERTACTRSVTVEP